MVLSAEEIERLSDDIYVRPIDIRKIEQAVLQSPEIREALSDKKRIDWLADPSNDGNVMLPRDIVLQNPHSLRDAIDSAMEQKT